MTLCVHDLLFFFWLLMILYWLSGLGLGDILKPDLVMPLIETLPVEQQLASYLPEVSANC